MCVAEDRSNGTRGKLAKWEESTQHFSSWVADLQLDTRAPKTKRSIMPQLQSTCTRQPWGLHRTDRLKSPLLTKIVKGITRWALRRQRLHLRLRLCWLSSTHSRAHPPSGRAQLVMEGPLAQHHILPLPSLVLLTDILAARSQLLQLIQAQRCFMTDLFLSSSIGAVLCIRFDSQTRISFCCCLQMGQKGGSNSRQW